MGMGFWEIVVIAVVALLFVGPEKLPQVAKFFASFFREVHVMKEDVRKHVYDVAEKMNLHDVVFEDKPKKPKYKEILAKLSDVEKKDSESKNKNQS